MNRSVLVLFGKIKYDFYKHINISTKNEKMKISKNKTYHEKVYDLSSPMIQHFQLNIKNSQSYDHFKKVPKGAAFFLSTTVYT